VSPTLVTGDVDPSSSDAVTGAVDPVDPGAVVVDDIAVESLADDDVSSARVEFPPSAAVVTSSAHAAATSSARPPSPRADVERARMRVGDPAYTIAERDPAL
jgi:hypothetical protein